MHRNYVKGFPTYSHIDGTVDPDFHLNGPILGANGQDGAISAVAIRPDGKLVVAGFFESFAGASRDNITRLEPDGAMDPSFVPRPGPNSSVRAITLEENGKVVIVGDFSSVNGVSRRRVARLNADGSLDDTFDIGTGSSSSVNTVVRQPDGKWIIGGFFTNFNGVASGRIARLSTNGSVDSSFVAGAGADGAVFSLALQADGKILVGGEFTNFAGSLRPGIARLNGDGTLDPSFASPIRLSVPEMAVQPDGKVIVANIFGVNLVPIVRKVLRLNADGSLDESFAPGLSIDGVVYTVALQSDGRVIIAGSFRSVDGYSRNSLARLEGDQPVLPELRIRDYARLGNGHFRLQFTHALGADYSVLASTNLENWEVVGEAKEIGPGRFEFTETTGATSDSRFYRVQAQ